MTTTPETIPETTQSLLEFGHAVLAVLHAFTHMPVRGVDVAHPRIARVWVGDPYSFVGIHNLAVWAQALHRPIRFHRSPLPEMVIRATLDGIRFDFEALLFASMVDEYEQRAGVSLATPRDLDPANVLAALGDHPDVRAANL